MLEHLFPNSCLIPQIIKKNPFLSFGTLTKNKNNHFWVWNKIIFITHPKCYKRGRNIKIIFRSKKIIKLIHLKVVLKIVGQYKLEENIKIFSILKQFVIGTWKMIELCSFNHRDRGNLTSDTLRCLSRYPMLRRATFPF